MSFISAGLAPRVAQVYARDAVFANMYLHHCVDPLKAIRSGCC